MDTTFVPFLLRAKRATYASSDEADQLAGAQQPSSRPASHDLGYREGDLAYLDTYLGGYSFAGEEAVWRAGVPLWSMNYYGTLLIPDPPADFGHFLKRALRGVPSEAPFRGPARFEDSPYGYTCRWEGSIDFFRGEEAIRLDGKTIYTLYFHGGAVR